LVGVLLGVTAALLWGTAGPFMRMADSCGITVLQVNLVRFIISSVVLLVVAVLFHPEAISPSRRERSLLFVLGASGMIMSALGLNVAFLHISVGLAMVIYYSAPCLVMAGSWFLGRDRPTRWQVSAFCMAIAGVWIAVGGARAMGTLDMVGLAGALTGAIGYALYILNGHYGTGKTAPFRSFLQTYLLATVMLFVMTFLRKEFTGLTGIPFRGWLVLGYLALGTSLIPFGLLALSLGRVSGSVASISTMGEVPFSMMWAWVICSEIPEKAAIAGGTLVILAIATLSLERSERVIQTKRESQTPTGKKTPGYLRKE